MRIFRTPSLLRALYPNLVWKINTDEKIIFLTFDDGPLPEITEFVLSTLKEFEAKATFFCIGNNISTYPNVFSEILSNGHRVGNHTYNHLKGWTSSSTHYIEDVEKCQQVIGETNFFRPPYGRITRNQIKLLGNYSIVMWDVLTYDYAKLNSREKTLGSVIRATRPGSIVVFHDSIKAEDNLRFMLPKFLTHFSKQGYRFESLPHDFS